MRKSPRMPVGLHIDRCIIDHAVVPSSWQLLDALADDTPAPDYTLKLLDLLQLMKWGLKQRGVPCPQGFIAHIYTVGRSGNVKVN